MKALFFVLFLFPLLLIAQEYPVSTESNSTYPVSFEKSDRIFVESFKSTIPVWSSLELLSLSEKENSIISIELSNAVDNSVSEIINAIEKLWSEKKYEAALSHFRKLNSDISEKMSIGINWREPIVTNQSDVWGTDVRIGNRDTVDLVSFDIHRVSGNLFTVLTSSESSTYQWSVNISTDGGETWEETYSFFTSFPVVDICGSVRADFFYVSYVLESSQDEGRIRKFNSSDGSTAAFGNGSNYVTAFTTTSPENIKEISLVSNQDFFNNRLYYAGITNQNKLLYFWANSDTLWTEIQTEVTNADRGLDIATNEDYNDYYLLASYITTGDSVQIDGHRAAGWDRLFKYYTNSSSALNTTAIGAYNDTVTVVFNHTASNNRCRYLVSYGLSSWLYGEIGDTTINSEAPDLTARSGGGVAIVSRFYTTPREGRFQWRAYSGTWSNSTSYTDFQPFYNKPAIEYLGDSKYGIVYTSWQSPVFKGVYFDRSDWVTDVSSDEQNSPANFELLQNYPNPFNPSTTISYVLPEAGVVNIKVFNILGKEIATLVNGYKSSGIYEVKFDASEYPSGIYFYQLTSGKYQVTKKMTLIK